MYNIIRFFKGVIIINEKTEKRRSFIINIAFFALFFAILYVLLVKALPLVMPFVIAFLIAAILNKPASKLNKKFPKLSKGLIGGILYVIILLIILGVIALAGVQITSYVKDFIKWLTSNFHHIPAYLLELKAEILKLTAGLPESIRTAIDNLINKYASTQAIKSIDVSKILTGAAGGLWSFAKSIPSILVATIVSIIATFFMIGSYDDVLFFIRAQLSRKNRGLVADTKQTIKHTLGNYAAAYGKIILITFGEILVSLYIMKLAKLYNGSFIPLIALGIAIVDILPVLGTGSIVVPWAIISMVSGNMGFGIALIVMWILISIIRQYIEPRIVGHQIGLNPLVTLFCMYVGLKLLGAIGMFLFPITIIILKALQDTGKIKIWRTKKDLLAEESEETGETQIEQTAENAEESKTED